MKSIIINILGKLATLIEKISIKYNILLAEKSSGCKIKFVQQGSGGLQIGHANNFFIQNPSHLKSNTYIECEGGVTIGHYFHTGRGLTIFSSNHDYDGGGESHIVMIQ